MFQESNQTIVKLDEFSNLEPLLESQNIIGKLGGCLKEFVVEWRNTTPRPLMAPSISVRSASFVLMTGFLSRKRFISSKFHVIKQNLMKGFITSFWFGKDMIGMEVKRRPKSLQNS